MSRSRVVLRERLRAPVPTSDPAALAAYADELRPVVATLRTLAEEAMLPASRRVHSRAFLRSGLLKSLRTFEARLAAAMPPEHADPAGSGGSPRCGSPDHPPPIARRQLGRVEVPAASRRERAGPHRDRGRQHVQGCSLHFCNAQRSLANRNLVPARAGRRHSSLCETRRLVRFILRQLGCG